MVEMPVTRAAAECNAVEAIHKGEEDSQPSSD